MIIKKDKFGYSNLGWLKSKFHFSFERYYDPNNMNFGVLRVLNDDLVQSRTGFPMHPHNNMEIISYVVNGNLTHQDSMGNQSTLKRGEVQYMSAGTGVMHSEYNLGDETLRLLQIWIVPDKRGLKPSYGDYRFVFADRKNKLLHLVSNNKGDAPIKINQDVNIYALYLEKDEKLDFAINRQAYLVQIEGKSMINKVNLVEQEALMIVEEELNVSATEDSHFIIIEMFKE